MTAVEKYLAHVENTFAIARVPANIRISRHLERIPFLRRLSGMAVGSGWLPAKGCFLYRNRGTEKQVNFNGRNLQFHALYEPGYRQGYELETALLMLRLCNGKNAFFDVGSNWGYFSLLMAAAPEFAGPIIAFEPNPRTFSDLASVIRQSGAESRVRAMNLGIGSSTCEMTLQEPDPFKTGLSHLSSSGDGAKIMVKRLDDLDIPVPGMLKIDAEGMEAEVLTGAARILEEIRPFVIVENFTDHKNPDRTCRPLEILRAKGYHAFAPALLFQHNNYLVPATYGSDFHDLLARDPKPQLALFEVTIENRFLLSHQLNIFAAHSSRLAEVWAAGILDLNRLSNH